MNTCSMGSPRVPEGSRVVHHLVQPRALSTTSPAPLPLTSRNPAYLDKSQHALDHLPALGAQQHEDGGQQARDGAFEPAGELEQQPGQRHDGGTHHVRGGANLAAGGGWGGVREYVWMLCGCLQ